MQNLLGYFLANKKTTCMILEWTIANYDLHYDDDHSISIIDNEENYTQMGTWVDIEETSEFNMSSDSEIPVFINYDDNDIATNISIDFELWIPCLETKEKRYEALETKLDKRTKTEKILTKILLGKVTTDNGGILICDSDMCRLCYDYGPNDDDMIQIDIPPEGSAKGFNAGIYYEIEGFWQIPVYGHYEDDKIKKVTIELNEATSIEE